MKFKIIRTSSFGWWDEGDPKCKEAFQEEVIINEGTEYEITVINWFVNINTLQELIEFVDKYENKVVITTYEQIPIIEIYDDWRE